MNKPFLELRDRMSEESKQRSEERAQALLTEIEVVKEAKDKYKTMDVDCRREFELIAHHVDAFTEGYNLAAQHLVAIGVAAERHKILGEVLAICEQRSELANSEFDDLLDALTVGSRDPELQRRVGVCIGMLSQARNLTNQIKLLLENTSEH